LPLWFALGSPPCLPQELGHVSAPVLAEVTPLVALAQPAAPPPPPPPRAPAFAALDETMRYNIAYSLLGHLGDLDIWFVHPEHGVRAVGVGKGLLLGAGTFEKRVDSHLDPRNPGTARWVTSRVQDGKTVVDTIVQAAPGTVEVVRRRAGRPDHTSSFRRGRPVLDPLGFLFALRAHPPTATTTYEVLDGRALWIITVRPPHATSVDGQAALVLGGRAEPVFWDGTPDNKDRDARDFTVWLSADALHTPLRLVIPLGVGEVRVSLARIDRTQPKRHAADTPAGSPTVFTAVAAALREASVER
jgi:hypothetical protein